MKNLSFSLLVALALSCLFRRRWAPWCDLDRLCRRALHAFLRTPVGGWQARPLAWQKSYNDRISLFKYAVWGLVLILLLPLHTLTASSWFVDELWRPLEKLRHALSSVTGDPPMFYHMHEWRDAPYELWEICVFLWVFPIIGRGISQDYIRLASHSPKDTVRDLQTGQLLAVLVFLFSAVGAFVLVVVQQPMSRIMFELAVVVILTVADIYYCRRWLALAQLPEAVKHFEVLLTVDLGAVIAFMALGLFLNLTNYSYRSQWVAAFVAGASAFNLLFANSTALVVRGIRNYREHREPMGDDEDEEPIEP